MAEGVTAGKRIMQLGHGTHERHSLVGTKAFAIFWDCLVPHTSPVAAPDPLRNWALSMERCD